MKKITLLATLALSSLLCDAHSCDRTRTKDAFENFLGHSDVSPRESAQARDVVWRLAEGEDLNRVFSKRQKCKATANTLAPAAAPTRGLSAPTVAPDFGKPALPHEVLDKLFPPTSVPASTVLPPPPVLRPIPAPVSPLFPLCSASPLESENSSQASTPHRRGTEFSPADDSQSDRDCDDYRQEPCRSEEPRLMREMLSKLSLLGDRMERMEEAEEERELARQERREHRRQRRLCQTECVAPVTCETDGPSLPAAAPTPFCLTTRDNGNLIHVRVSCTLDLGEHTLRALDRILNRRSESPHCR